MPQSHTAHQTTALQRRGSTCDPLKHKMDNPKNLWVQSIWENALEGKGLIRILVVQKRIEINLNFVRIVIFVAKCV